MIGRTEQVDLENGIISNYACQNWCESSYHASYVTATSVEVEVGDQVTYRAYQRDMDHYGDLGEYYQRLLTVNGATYWSSNPTGVATISGNSVATATATGAGTTTITATWQDYNAPVGTTCGYFAETDDNPDAKEKFGSQLNTAAPRPNSPEPPCANCANYSIWPTPSVSLTVNPTIDSIGNAFGPVGTTFTITIAGTGFRAAVGGVAKTSFAATGSGVTFSNVNVENQYLANATVTITATATEGSRTVSVTVTPASGPSQTSAGEGNKTFFVQIPTSFTPVADPPDQVIHDPTPGDFINGYGIKEKENVCGGYRNYGYILRDQSDNPIVTQMSVTEELTGFTQTGGLSTPAATSFPTTPEGKFWDINLVNGTGGCPGAFNFSNTQKFKVVLGSTTFNLPTTNHLAGSKSSSGTYSFTVTNTNP